MRTTINLPDELFRQVKRLAAQRGTTVTAMVEEALREALARRRTRTELSPVTLTTFGTSKIQSGVDLDDSAALLDIMDGWGGPDRR